MNSDPQTWDTIVIGAGAAGLMAATGAALRGRNVLLLEKNRKLGVKILMSGGTRCNITHNCDPRRIAEAFGRQGKFLHSPLAALSPNDVVQKIESQGVKTKVESTGKIFPESNKAIDVRDALVQMAIEAGAIIYNQQPVTDVERTEESDSSLGHCFRVHTQDRLFHCRRLLITTGGKSYPGCGTTGDGYAWARKFGHAIVNPVPALTPITCNRNWANELKGVTLDDTRVEIWEADDLALAADSLEKKRPQPRVAARGSLLFTHFGFSGPPILDASRVVARHTSPENLILICDFLPSKPTSEFIDLLSERARTEGKQTVVSLLSRLLPKRLAEALIKESKLPPQKRNAELSKTEIQRVVDAVKHTRLAINGTLGFKKAEVTAGGVDLKEVDSRNMQSKLVTNLFFAGEILDLDGPIGGYNFQSAFSTGWLAGQHL